MLDIKFIRENKDIIEDAINKKGVSCDLSALIALDDARLAILKEVEDLRSSQNRASEEISQMVDFALRAEKISTMKLIKDELSVKEDTLREVLKGWHAAMLSVPNIPHHASPVGPDETYSRVSKTWGEKTSFSFPVKDHIDLMLSHKMVDFERGTKVHGFRGYFLTGDGVRLCFAIWNYALDFYSDRGFTPILPPINVRRDALLGCGFIPQGEADIYKAQDDSYFVGTSEVPLMGMYMDEILSKEDLPKKMLGFSPCYRLEAGSHARDTKGLIRVHEFYKFEQVVLCEGSHQESVQHHEEIQQNIEEFIESLNIPYQVIDASTGDMGFTKVRMYDTELWVPKEEKYREIGSASYFHDFQTRRLGIRYRDEDGRVRYTHSLNCTAIPTPRILVSLVENFQQADGSIKIPDVLVPYFGKNKIG
jgi:seryl-tRNA synthetase